MNVEITMTGICAILLTVCLTFNTITIITAVATTQSNRFNYELCLLSFDPHPITLAEDIRNMNSCKHNLGITDE